MNAKLWCSLSGIWVLDADGWPLGTWEDEIDRPTFLARATLSTIKIYNQERFTEFFTEGGE